MKKPGNPPGFFEEILSFNLEGESDIRKRAYGFKGKGLPIFLFQSGLERTAACTRGIRGKVRQVLDKSRSADKVVGFSESRDHENTQNC